MPAWRVPPGGVATAAPRWQSLGLHATVMRLDQVGERVVANLDEAIGLEESFDVRRRAATEKRQLAFETGVLAAGPGILVWTDRHVLIKLAVEHDKPAARPEYPHPLRHRGLGMRQGPQHVTADYEIKDARGEGKVFGVTLLKPDRDIGW